MRKRTKAFSEAGRIGRGGWNEWKEVCASEKEKDEHPMGEEKEKALDNLVVKPVQASPIPFHHVHVSAARPLGLSFYQSKKSRTEHTQPFFFSSFNHLHQDLRPPPLPSPQSASLSVLHTLPNPHYRKKGKKVMSSRTTTVRPTRTTTKSQDSTTSQQQQQTEPPSTQDRCAHCKKFLSAVKAECRHCRLVFCMEHR